MIREQIRGKDKPEIESCHHRHVHMNTTPNKNAGVTSQTGSVRKFYWLDKATLS